MVGNSQKEEKHIHYIINSFTYLLLLKNIVHYYKLIIHYYFHFIFYLFGGLLCTSYFFKKAPP